MSLNVAEEITPLDPKTMKWDDLNPDEWNGLCATCTVEGRRFDITKRDNVGIDYFMTVTIGDDVVEMGWWRTIEDAKRAAKIKNNLANRVVMEIFS